MHDFQNIIFLNNGYSIIHNIVIFFLGFKNTALFVLGPARAKPKTTFEEYMRIEKEFSEPGTLK